MCCGGAAASDWTSIDDLPIDPAQDLEDMTDWLNRQPAGEEQQDGSVQPPDGGDAAVADDGDIMPLADKTIFMSGGTMVLHSGSVTCTATSNGVAISGNVNQTPSFPSSIGYLSANSGYGNYWSSNDVVYRYSFSGSAKNVSYKWSIKNYVLRLYWSVDMPANTEEIVFWPGYYKAGNQAYSSFSFGSNNIVPTKVHLELNGSVVSSLTYTEFSKQTTGWVVDVTSFTDPITSIGLRFAYPTTEFSQTVSTSDNYTFPLHIMLSRPQDVLLTYSTGNTGLLNSIIEWLQKILNGITSIGKAIAALPGQIVNLLVDALKSLFIPDQETVQAIFTKYNTLLETKLGFIWQLFQFVETAISGLVSGFSSGTAYQFVFPGVSVTLSGELYELIPQTPVSLDNPLMDVVRPVVGTIFSFISVAWVVNKAEDMVIALVSGASYLSWHNLSDLEGLF